MTASQKRKAKSRRIADAALSLFSRKGYGGTSVGEIAKAAGVGKGTLYAYYTTKAEMFAAALAAWMAGFEARVQECLGGIDEPEAKLHAVAEANIAFVSALDPETTRLTVAFLQQSLLPEGVLYHRRHLLSQLYTGQRRMIVDILLEGVSRGRFAPRIAKDTEKIAVNLLACFDGIFLHSIVSENAFCLRDQVLFYLDNLMATLRPHAPDSAGVLPAAAEAERTAGHTPNPTAWKRP